MLLQSEIHIRVQAHIIRSLEQLNWKNQHYGQNQDLSLYHRVILLV